jgi:Xaa-Pro aminopeptidase
MAAFRRYFTVTDARSGGAFQNRQTALWQQAELEDLDGLLITAPANCRYLCGFSGSNANLLLTCSDSLLLTDGRYAKQSEREVAGATVRIVEGTLAEELKEVLTGGQLIGFESEQMTVAAAQRLREANHMVSWRPIGRPVERLRQVKDPTEISRISEAVRMAEAALEETIRGLEPGRSELEVAGLLEMNLRTQGSEGSAFEPIVASGIRGSMPHGKASSRTIENGDLVTIDFGAICEGYHSDLTRTYSVGEPDPRTHDWYAAVNEAVDAALEAARPGQQCSDLDAVAREKIAEAGLGEYFVHNLGHGIGLEVHEDPRLSPKSTHSLEAGMVVTIEPGVYVPDLGGLRIEENVVITADGAHLLSTASREIEMANLKA